jgi:O-antigen ligase
VSITGVAWFAAVVFLALRTFKQPAYGVALYLVTFFVNPQYWWWGDPFLSIRWNLIAGLLLLVGLAMNPPAQKVSTPSSEKVGRYAVLMAANALAVHFALAPIYSISETLLILLLKFVLLYFLMVRAIRTPQDMRVVLWSILLAAAYIGWEVTINDRGRFSGGRLEGVGAAGVQNSNELASLLLVVIPLGGYLFLTSQALARVLAAASTALVLNVVLSCNSRGAFLGLIVGGVVIVTMAPRTVRTKVLKGVALGSLALLLLMRDPKIMSRFMTIFVSSEERDGSAETRLVIWSAVFAMVKDHPLGAGGESFSQYYGRIYLPGVGYDSNGRSVHNGYLNEITNWGLQGLYLRLAFFVVAFIGAFKTGRPRARDGDAENALLAACLISAAVGVLVSAFFGDYLDDEWGLWMVALVVAQSRICELASRSPEATPSPALVAGVPLVATVGRAIGVTRYRPTTPLAARHLGDPR